MCFANLVEIDSLLDDAISELEKKVEQDEFAGESDKHVNKALENLYKIKEFYKT